MIWFIDEGEEEEEEDEDGVASTTDSLSSSRPHTPKHEQMDYAETGNIMVSQPHWKHIFYSYVIRKICVNAKLPHSYHARLASFWKYSSLVTMILG